MEHGDLGGVQETVDYWGGGRGGGTATEGDYFKGPGGSVCGRVVRHKVTRGEINPSSFQLML